MHETRDAEHGWSLANFNDTIHRGGVALWAWSPERRLAQLDSLCRSFWGVDGSVVGIDDLFARMHEDDRAATEAAWFGSAADPEPYSFDFRIGSGEDALWISARGIGGEEGRADGWVQAIFLDVTERRRAEDAARLVSTEMAHRIANMFAVARALTAIVARQASDVGEFARDLDGRFEVLHRATALATGARSIATESIPFRDFLDNMLLPYVGYNGVTTISVADTISIPEGQISNYAMIFHELATNSAKYGAYSGNGTLTVLAEARDDMLEIRWSERLWREVRAERRGTGFGSTLLDQTIRRGLRGTIERHLDADALEILITVPQA